MKNTFIVYMNILIIGENALVNLSPFHQSLFSTFTFISSVYAQQLAALTPKKHQTHIQQGNEPIPYDSNIDIVHIHFKTATAIRAYQIADHFKEKGKHVILSGAHTTALPEEAKNHANTILIGNAQQVWPIVVAKLEEGKIHQRYYSKKNNKESTISSVNIPTKSDSSIIGVIEATKGCPYKCDFCQDSNIIDGSIFQPQPIHDVIHQIKMLPQKYILFCDVSMTIDVNYTKELFKQMIPLRKKFVCEGNVDVLAHDDDLLRISQKAGCIEWTAGFESFNQHVLDSQHKKTNAVEDYYQAVKKVHNHNMAILGNFIFGFDQDTTDLFDTIVEKIQNIGLDSARFALLTPYPGTPLYNQFEDKERILTKDWSKYNRKNVVFIPKNMTPKQLQEGYINVSKKFNSLSRVIPRDLKSVNLGLYPFLATVLRNIESYFSRPRSNK